MTTKQLAVASYTAIAAIFLTLQAANAGSHSTDPVGTGIAVPVDIAVTTVSNPTDKDTVTLRIAVAANFHTALVQLRQAFTEKIAPAVRPRIKISSGATGALYHQILNGAPFDILFAADRKTPELLAEHGIGQRQSLFNYAYGRMLLVTRLGAPHYVAAACRKEASAADQRRVLIGLLNASQRIVLANPRTAPYGFAGQEILQGLQPAAASALANKVVLGRNILHAQQLFERTDADTALLSQAQSLAQATAQIEHPRSSDSARTAAFNYCEIPGDLYIPLQQAAVLLQPPAHNATPAQRNDKKAVAKQFIHFVQSAQGRAIIEHYGYTTTPIQPN